MHSGTFDAEFLGLTIDAFTRGTLAIDGLVERAGTIEIHAHQATQLDVDMFDTALGLVVELFVFTGALQLTSGEEERTAIHLGAIAIGMGKWKGGMHA